MTKEKQERLDCILGKNKNGGNDLNNVNDDNDKMITMMTMMMMMTTMMMPSTTTMMMMMIVGTYGDYSSKSVPVSITTLTYEQKGCREKSRGTKDQLPIDRAILRDFK